MVSCCSGILASAALGVGSRRSRTDVRSCLLAETRLAAASLDCMDAAVRQCLVTLGHSRISLPSFPRRRESCNGGVLSVMYHNCGDGFRLETIACQGYAYAFSPCGCFARVQDVPVRRSGVPDAPGVQSDLRRRNDFVEAIKKPRICGAFVG
jgi:hypothetical protein